MSKLTTKELGYIEDEVRAEEITAKTMNWFASQCKDQEIGKTLEQLAEQHQLKVGEISKYFNRANDIH